MSYFDSADAPAQAQLLGKRTSVQSNAIANNDGPDNFRLDQRIVLTLNQQA